MRIIIPTCDAFHFMVPVSARFMRLNMGMDYHVTVVSNTNSGSTELDELYSNGVIDDVVYVGEDSGWSNNMLLYLEESELLESNDPILLMLDDYIIQSIDFGLLEEAVKAIELHNNVGMVRLVPIPGPTLSWNNGGNHHKDIGMLDKTTHTSYCMSLQIALWKPRTLLKTLEPDLNAWKTEGRGSRRISQGKICRSTQFLCAYEPAIEYLNILRRGKPDSKSMEWLDRQGVDINGIRGRTK